MPVINAFLAITIGSFHEIERADKRIVIPFTPVGQSCRFAQTSKNERSDVFAAARGTSASLRWLTGYLGGAAAPPYLGDTIEPGNLDASARRTTLTGGRT